MTPNECCMQPITIKTARIGVLLLSEIIHSLTADTNFPINSQMVGSAASLTTKKMKMASLRRRRQSEKSLLDRKKVTEQASAMHGKISTHFSRSIDFGSRHKLRLGAPNYTQSTSPLPLHTNFHRTDFVIPLTFVRFSLH